MEKVYSPLNIAHTSNSMKKLFMDKREKAEIIMQLRENIYHDVIDKKIQQWTFQKILSHVFKQ